MYDEFKVFVGGEGPNTFWRVEGVRVRAAEEQLGYMIPSQLRSFLLEVGYGFYTKGTEDADCTDVNRIMGPGSIRAIVQDHDCPERPPEGLPPGVMPSFDLGEYTYLVLRPTSDVPNRVYAPGGKRIISESVESFFRQLYRRAAFYHDCF